MVAHRLRLRDAARRIGCVVVVVTVAGTAVAGGTDAGDAHAEHPERLALEGSVERANTRPHVLQGGLSSSLVDVTNRVWLGRGRAAFGVGVGAQALRIDPPTDPLRPVAWQPLGPSMSLGWRYSLTETSSLYAGATAARAWGDPDALPQYGARAGVEWKAARSRLGFDGGRLGLQLDSGYRMSIRTRSGGVQVALRKNF